jgi:hypothetical protein
MITTGMQCINIKTVKLGPSPAFPVYIIPTCLSTHLPTPYSYLRTDGETCEPSKNPYSEIGALERTVHSLCLIRVKLNNGLLQIIMFSLTV